MKIKHEFCYNADADEIANEFCYNDSEYQADVFNAVGRLFYRWSKDKTRPFTHAQILEIVEQLDDKGEWFLKTLCELVEAKTGERDEDMET